MKILIQIALKFLESNFQKKALGKFLIPKPKKIKINLLSHYFRKTNTFFGEQFAKKNIKILLIKIKLLPNVFWETRRFILNASLTYIFSHIFYKW